MKARIIDGAGKAFISNNLKHNSGMTTEMRSYIDKLVELEGTVLDVIRTYDKRVVLEYPVSKTTKDGRDIIGIDMEIEYVEMVT